MSDRAYYSDTLASFLARDELTVLGQLTAASEFDVDLPQREAWQAEVRILRSALASFHDGHVFLEFVVPRLGKRIDTVLLLHGRLIVLEFKIGATSFGRTDIDQVWDYALDLKNFHETSHHRNIWPALVITGKFGKLAEGAEGAADKVAEPTLLSSDRLGEWLAQVAGPRVEEATAANEWQRGRYRPTPTIIEAATSLYRRHSVHEIARHDAGAKNLACMFRALGWRDSLRYRPQQRTDSFEQSPTPPTNVDEELSGVRSPCGDRQSEGKRTWQAGAPPQRLHCLTGGSAHAST